MCIGISSKFPARSQQGQGQHRAFPQADADAGPDGAPGPFGDQRLKGRVEFRLVGFGAVDMVVAQHLAADGHTGLVAFQTCPVSFRNWMSSFA